MRSRVLDNVRHSSITQDVSKELIPVIPGLWVSPGAGEPGYSTGCVNEATSAHYSALVTPDPGIIMVMVMSGRRADAA